MVSSKFNIPLRLIAINLLFLFFCFFNLNCLERPKIPSWDTEINIPLLNDTYGVSDLLKVSKNIRIVEDSILQFYSEFNIDTVTPHRILNFNDQYFDFNYNLSEFAINNLSIGRLVFRLNDLVGFMLPDFAINLVVPNFNQTIGRNIDLTDIQNLELSYGIWKFNIKNFTSLDFDSLVLHGQSLPYIRTNEIEANSSSLLEQKVESVRVQNPLSVEITLGSAGSAPDSVLVSGLDSLVIELTIDSLKIASGTLRLPETRTQHQNLVNFSLNQNFNIDSLQLATGEAILKFLNMLPASTRLNLSIEQLNFNQEFGIGANDSVFITIPLAGLKLGNHDSPSSQGPPGIKIDIVITTEPTLDFVTVESGDGIIANYQIFNLNFQHLSGTLVQSIYVNSPEKVLISLPGQGTHGLRVASAEVNLRLCNAIGFPASIRFRVFARKDNGDSINQVRDIDVQPGSNLSPTEINITIPVTDVINFGARCIKFTADIQIFGRGRVDANSFALGNGCLSTPLRLAFSADTTILGDYKFSLPENDRQSIIDWQSGRNDLKIVSAEFFSEISNHFPVGFNARIVVAKDTSNPSQPGEESDSIVVPLHVTSGIVTGPSQNQYCTKSKDSTMTFNLDESDISLFTQPSLRSHLVLCFLPSDTVTVRLEDYLQLLSTATIKLRIK